MVLVRYKVLRLITQEKAAAEGIQAEGPVFVSAFIARATVCPAPECRNVETGRERQYSPLVYQTGSTVIGQHFHRDGYGGGIYYFTDRKEAEKSKPQVGGFLAVVSPLGEVIEADGIPIGRSQAIAVRSMQLYCAADSSPRQMLREGLLLKDRGQLRSVCESHGGAFLAGWRMPVVLRFSVVAGRVIFADL
jgi:hypothetical protein